MSTLEFSYQIPEMCLQLATGYSHQAPSRYSLNSGWMTEASISSYKHLMVIMSKNDTIFSFQTTPFFVFPILVNGSIACLVIQMLQLNTKIWYFYP